jgi:hypothetical protein
MSAVVWQNDIVVVGGRTQATSGDVNTVYTAQISDSGQISMWSTATSLPTTPITHVSAATVQGVFIMGGSNSTAVLEGIPVN